MTEENNLSADEVRQYIISEYEYLNLTESQIQQYVKFILKIDKFRKYNVKLKNIGSALAFFEEKFNLIYDMFLSEGYNRETSLELTKRAILYSDRKKFLVILNLLRMLALEEQTIINGYILHMRFPENTHAKKCFFMEINHHDTDNKIFKDLFKISDKAFEDKFNTNVAQLLKKYPLSEETKEVWRILANLTDEKLYEEYHLTRQEMAEIYPTTKEELKILKLLSNLSDKEIIAKYGITRAELLRKYPLNSDTLRAIISINKTDDDTVAKLFDQPKSEVLKLRTITTEMILLANEKIKLKRKYYSKEELKEKLMNKKRGTI